MGNKNIPSIREQRVKHISTIAANFINNHLIQGINIHLTKDEQVTLAWGIDKHINFILENKKDE